jgi:apolipoprotein D and lipocalin family protein
MKSWTLAALVLSLFVSAQARSEIQTVSYVDVGRYLGTWYQIAKNPLVFEGNCYCSQQKLGVKGPGVVSVYNSCNRNSVNGPIAEISGEAVVVDPVTNAKLSVDFNLPHKGEYWIIGLDSDYRYAVVTDSRGDSLYILSKTPFLAQDLYDEAVAAAARQVRTDRLEQTVHAGCTYP